MPFVLWTAENDQWPKLARRLLISGPPNSGKTYSLRTLKGRMAYVSYPGEGGASSLNRAEIEAAKGKCWIWENAPVGTPTDYGKMCREIRQLTVDILAGKLGEFDVFVGDGLHKLYQMHLADQTTGASEAGDEFEARLYGGTHKRFFNYLRLVRDSAMKTVVFTVWDGRERDNPELKGPAAKDDPTHIFPELPGAAAKAIMGEFSVVVYAAIDTIGVDRKYKWQTKPAGKVWGCGIKLPAERNIVLPLFVPQDLTALINLLDPPTGTNTVEAKP